MEPADQVERQLARHLAGRALWVAPVVVLVAGLVQGWAGALGAAIGLAVVIANFLAAAGAATWAAHIGPGAIASTALAGYALRLGAVFVVLIAFRGVDAVDMASLVLTVAGLHLVLLFAEMRSVRLSLAEPGLKITTPLPADLAAKE